MGFANSYMYYCEGGFKRICVFYLNAPNFISVFKQNDESVSDEASVTFSTLSQPLDIRVPPYVQGLPTAAVTVDASWSTDPDNTPDKASFFWACAKVTSFSVI
jgi:hypothetical protein